MEPLYIFKGFKLVGMRDHLGIWWKIEQDCIQCGQCCMDQGPNWIFAQDEIMGGCRYLVEDPDGTYRCGLGYARPFRCCGNSPYSGLEYCSVKFKRIKKPIGLLK